MTKRIKSVLLILICIILPCGFIVSAFAENENKYDSSSGILLISHRGDTALYQSNSKEAVLSAFEKGADFVSVNIKKAGSGELVLCSENESEITGTSLKEMLSLLGENKVLILDFDISLKDEVYSFIESEDAFSSAVLRINDSADNIVSWLENKNEKLQVIGVYDSFVVFSAVKHLKTLSENGMALVQYQSKNYFNEMFGSFVTGELLSENSAKAVAAMYDPDLCGQRSDSEDGWNDLIKKGFSVIETANLNSFLSYIKSVENSRLELSELYSKAEKIETEKYNTVSRENLLSATETAEILLKRDFASADELQSSFSGLLLAMENLALKTDEDTQKGALNITSGKIIAAVLVGAAILTAQAYTYKMQKGKKR